MHKGTDLLLTFVSQVISLPADLSPTIGAIPAGFNQEILLCKGRSLPAELNRLIEIHIGSATPYPRQQHQRIIDGALRFSQWDPVEHQRPARISCEAQLVSSFPGDLHTELGEISTRPDECDRALAKMLL